MAVSKLWLLEKQLNKSSMMDLEKKYYLYQNNVYCIENVEISSALGIPPISIDRGFDLWLVHYVFGPMVFFVMHTCEFFFPSVEFTIC